MPDFAVETLSTVIHFGTLRSIAFTHRASICVKVQEGMPSQRAIWMDDNLCENVLHASQQKIAFQARAILISIIVLENVLHDVS